jgi:hypothetical protein
MCPKPFVVTTVSQKRDELEFGDPQFFATKLEAMTAAKRLAGKNPKFSPHYGPTSAAYVGDSVCAVVSWKEHWPRLDEVRG